MTEDRLLFHEIIKSQSLEQISSSVYPDLQHCIVIVYSSTESPPDTADCPIVDIFYYYS